jgi:hypothetical protein
MWGECLREIGLLYFVFGILDAQIEARRGGSDGNASWYASVVAIGAIIWVVGAAVERLRRD